MGNREWGMGNGKPTSNPYSLFPIPGSSALLPRQPFVPPAGLRVAMVLLVELTLEAMKDIRDLGEPGFLERAAGVERAITASADEDDGAIDARRLLHVRDEV